MEKIGFRDFRCFFDQPDVPLRPLTILVGENSTGKSSFLAGVRLAYDLAFAGGKRVDFNEEPFLLGAYDQIATFRGGRGGRAETFSLSFEHKQNIHPRRTGAARVLQFRHVVEFRRQGSHPVIHEQRLWVEGYQLKAQFPDDGAGLSLSIEQGDKKAKIEHRDPATRVRVGPEAPVDWSYVAFVLLQMPDRGGDLPPFDSKEMSFLRDALVSFQFRRVLRPFAIAPVRTRPQRTYNPVSDVRLPEGGHIPMVLAKKYFEKKREDWQRLTAMLNQFGAEAGLFSRLGIKTLGRHESDPFQLRVTVNGPPTNLVDVGYGVSQVLPVLVDTILAAPEATFLLQQPEVHLHPKAQAALGSFFARLVASQRTNLIIETHSDYLLDRIRTEVRDSKQLKATDVSILFFERRVSKVKVHAIELDDVGNLLNVPPGYRKFFLSEERKFMGGT